MKSFLIHNGEVIELQHFYIISTVGSTHAADMDDPQISCFLQPWVIDLINSIPELRIKFGR